MLIDNFYFNYFQLLVSLQNYVVQAKNEEVCCESLRVLANISRHREFLKFIEKLRFTEALIILLNYNNKDIVFYAMGVLINLVNDEEIR